MKHNDLKENINSLLREKEIKFSSDELEFLIETATDKAYEYCFINNKKLDGNIIYFFARNIIYITFRK